MGWVQEALCENKTYAMISTLYIVIFSRQNLLLHRITVSVLVFTIYSYSYSYRIILII